MKCGKYNAFNVRIRFIGHVCEHTNVINMKLYRAFATKKSFKDIVKEEIGFINVKIFGNHLL